MLKKLIVLIYGEKMNKKNIRECFGINRNKYKEVKSNKLDLSL